MLFKSNLILLITVFSLNLRNSDINSLRFNILGLLSTIAKVLNPNELSILVNLYNCLLTVSVQLLF